MGPEFISTNKYKMAKDLNPSTNYTFYVRLYSNVASDSSDTVTCKTGKFYLKYMLLQLNCYYCRCSR